MKLWGARFTKETHSLVRDFHSSIHFDQRLCKYDIQGSIAHAEMLAKVGILNQVEGEQITQGLRELLRELDEGKVKFDPGAEDIHTNIEALLIAKIGDVAKKLHTARSRNDQVALDLRLYLLEEIRTIQSNLISLIEALKDIGEKNVGTIMPGYTHLQRAQPITLAHHFLAYISMFQRDHERLSETLSRTAVSPLGSGALAGTSLEIDREFTAQRLGLQSVSMNTLDGVSDRDFAIEFCSHASLVMMHLSRLSEELVLWSSQEFRFVELDDAFSTGSSMMPQKKNPDVPELVRGKTGRVYGNLMCLLTVLKGLPLAYNKDLQEDKEAIFDTVDTVRGCLAVMVSLLNSLKFNSEKMLESTREGFLNATDLADFLVKKNVPFRECHHIVGKIIQYSVRTSKTLEELTLEELNRFSDRFSHEVYGVLQIRNSVEARNGVGGPASGATLSALQGVEKWLEGFQT